MITWIFFVFASMLGLGLITFYAGVMSARRRNLRLVFVRTTALLGICAAWGASVTALQAETPLDEASQTDAIKSEARTSDAPHSDTPHSDAPHSDALEVLNATIHSLAENATAGTIATQYDPNFIDRYTDLDVLLSMEDASDEATAASAFHDVAYDSATPEVTPAEPVNETNAKHISVDVSPHAWKCGSAYPILDSAPVEAEFASVETTRSEPQWLHEPAVTKGNGNHSLTVTSDPWATEVEARTALEENIWEAVAEYVDDQIGERNAFRKIRLSSTDVHSFQIIQDRYADEYQSSVGPMQRKHARLVFTPAFRSEIAQRWQQHLVTARLVKTGFGVMCVMGMLFIALGVFKRLGSSVR